MARRALASAAQLRELDGAWEKVATELGAAVTFALSQRPKDPLAAIVEHLSRLLPAGSMVEEYNYKAVLVQSDQGSSKSQEASECDVHVARVHVGPCGIHKPKYKQKHLT